jgi:cell wall-associated NlpC family hydrolase
MKKGICLLGMIPLRRKPSEKSEMVSQLLFGEGYEITEETSAWYNILTQFDHYAGWIDKKLFSPVSDEYFKNLEQGSYSVLSIPVARIEAPDGSALYITAGSTLGKKTEKGIVTIDTLSFRYTDPVSEPGIPSDHSIAEFAKQFLNSPYLWGGRSVFGLDCSGFTQIVYKIHGTSLPRDASQQAAVGKSISNPEEIREGDLVFFGDDKSDVVHVGRALPPDRIIHCSGKVRIDRLDEKGIFNQQTGAYTHRLHSVRRI